MHLFYFPRHPPSVERLVASEPPTLYFAIFPPKKKSLDISLKKKSIIFAYLKIVFRRTFTKKSLVFFSMVLSYEGSSLGITYLNSASTGAGDGSSWNDAFTSVADAVNAVASGDKIVYAAQGVYLVPSQVTPPDGMKFYGGFPALSMDEGLNDRNVDLYQTILSGDIKNDDTWDHVEPDYATYSLVKTPTTEPLIQNGKVNLFSTFSDDYDTISDATKPWRNVADKTKRVASVTGLTQESPIIPDAFGAARHPSRIALGPINTPSPRTMLLIK